MNHRRTFRAALAVLAVGLATAGCSVLFPAKDAPRNSEGEITSSAKADVFSLKLGDCVGPLADGDITESTVMPCSDPHNYEAYAAFDLPDGDFPDLLDEEVDAKCSEEFEAFLGIPYEDSIYEMFSISPTRESWAVLDDRSVICLVGTDEGGLTATLAGAAE
ncbi:MAG: septum formation family protein [Bifidobacteriaceae bacterium]|jgi:hypothetical protein|nr:septum formation family protein [Bifidobacteriaceae bacterium]